MSPTTPHVPALSDESRYWRWVGAFEMMWQDIGQVIDSYVGRVARRACEATRQETRAATMESCARIAVITGNTTEHCTACCYAVADYLRAAAKGLP